MNKRYSTIMSVAAVAVMAGALFGSTLTAAPISVQGANTPVSALEAVERLSLIHI